MGLFSAPAIAQQQAKTVEKATHGSWSIRCLESNQALCAMTQIGNSAQGEKLVSVEFQKFPTPQTAEGRSFIGQMVITAPIGVLLPAGVGVTIDGRQEGVAIYKVCYPQQCIVVEPVSEEFVNKMKRGSNVTMTLRNAAGKEAKANLSLSGFTKAFNSL